MRERRIAAIHVSPSHLGGWAIRLSARRRAMRRFPVKSTAVSVARFYARKLGVPLVLHYLDGTVQAVIS